MLISQQVIPMMKKKGRGNIIIIGATASKRGSIKTAAFAPAKAAQRSLAEQGCHMVQLTTDKTRLDALEFYEKCGFVASHEGLKLYLINEHKAKL